MESVIARRQDQLIDDVLRSLRVSCVKSFNKDTYNINLDKLNAEFSRYECQSQKIEPLFEYLCDHIPHNEELLVTKFMQFLVCAIRKESILKTKDCISKLSEYIVSCLKNCSEWVYADVLLVLSMLSAERSCYMKSILDEFIGKDGVLQAFCSVAYKDTSLKLLAIKTVEAITLKTPNEAKLDEKYLYLCYKILLDVIVNLKLPEVDLVSYAKILTSALNGIENILFMSSNVHLDSVGLLLSALKVHIFHGLPGPTVSRIESLYPTPIGQLIPSAALYANEEVERTPSTSKHNFRKSRKRHSNPNKKKSNVLSSNDHEINGYYKSVSNESVSTDEATLKPAWQIFSSSDSEYSDTEAGNRAKLRSIEMKVRLSAFSTLKAVFKVTDRKLMFGYWSCFLPDTPSISNTAFMQTRTILFSILKDSSPQVRVRAISVVSAMVESAKQFLFLADDRQQHKTAFTSFSSTVASMIKELHRCLILAIIAENCSIALTQLLKCLSILVQSVPYHKLLPGLLTKISRNARPLLLHKVFYVQVACLSVMSAIIGINPLVSEAEDILFKQELSVCESIEKLNIKVPNTSGVWLIDLCLAFIKETDVIPSDSTPEIGMQLRLESLQVVCLFIQNHFGRLQKHIDIFVELICWCLKDTDSNIRLHGLKLLLATSGSILLQINQEKDDGSNVSADATKFWLACLNGPLPQIFQDGEQKLIQTYGCDCIANINSKIYENLPKDKQILCVTIIIGFASDHDKVLSGAAIRALGIFVSFQLLKEDILFLADVSEIMLRGMKDNNVGVKIKASWSLANLTNTLLDLKMEGSEFISDMLTSKMLFQLIEVCVKFTGNSDKVQYNSVRALGNLLHLVPESFISSGEKRTIVIESINELVSSASKGLNKVRWNACYAIGNVFQNNSLLKMLPEQVENIFCAIQTLMTSCHNHKIRINATNSLCMLRCRDQFQATNDNFISIWCSLISCLEQNEDITDFNVYKLMENLKEHVIKCLLHLLSLAELKDCEVMNDVLQKSLPCFVDEFRKFQSAKYVKPEMHVENAKKHLETIVGNGEEEVALVATMKQIFHEHVR